MDKRPFENLSDEELYAAYEDSEDNDAHYDEIDRRSYLRDITPGEWISGQVIRALEARIAELERQLADCEGQ